MTLKLAVAWDILPCCNCSILVSLSAPFLFGLHTVISRLLFNVNLYHKIN